MRLLELMDPDPWPTELAWMSQLITPEDSVAAAWSRQIATSVCQPDYAPAPCNVSAGTDAAAANTNLAAPCIKTNISEILPKASIDSTNDHHQITPSSRSPIRQKRHRYLMSALFELRSSNRILQIYIVEQEFPRSIDYQFSCAQELLYDYGGGHIFTHEDCELQRSCKGGS
jgi:hypothetical protein